LWASCFAFLGLKITALGGGFPVAWGNNVLGLTNPPASISNVVAIAAGQYHNLAILENGTIAGWGDNSLDKATSPPGLTGVIAVAGGANHSVALRNDGRVVAWGDQTVTNVPPGITDGMGVAAGQFHSLVVRSNGTVIGWGGNNQGQATPPPGLSGVIAIAAGANHSLALRANGTVVGWGANNRGQATVPINLSGVVGIAAGDDFSLALRNTGTIAVWGNLPQTVQAGVVAIAAGGRHGMALLNNRTVFCWGDNFFNQTVVPPGTTNVVAIAGGATHSVALRMAPPRIVAHPTPRAVLRGASTTFSASFTGSTPLHVQWRHNGTAIPDATNATYTIGSVQTNNAGNYSLLLSNAIGTAQSTNALLTVNVPAFIAQEPQSVDVGIGASASFSVAAGGSTPITYRWRKNGTNIPNAINPTYTIPSVTTNHAGDYRVVVSNAFGFVTSAVATLTIQPLPFITSQPQSQSLLVGGSASFSVSANNAAGYQWQKNNTNISGANQSIYNITGVQTNDAGNFRVIVNNQFGAVTSAVATLTVNVPPPGDNLVVQWGENPVFNGFDQVDITVPAGLSGVKAVAAGAYHDLALLSNGRVFGWGDNLFGQAGAPPTLINAMRISAGVHHSVALTSNGTVVAWGFNNLKQTDVPVGLASVRAIAAGGYHSLALRSNGTVAAWGHTNYGQTVVPSNTTNVMAITAGLEHSMALLSNGTLRTWGNNDFGQRIPPFPLSNLTAIAGGRYHSVGLRNDGRVFAWGQNNFGQTNVPPEATNIVAIAAGANHNMALRRDGALICWGQNNFLQLQPPDGLGGVSAIAAGGNRSLALRTKLLRMQTPQRLANGSVRLRIANQDGSPIDPARTTKVEIYASSDPGLPRAQWTKRNIPLSVVTGALEGVDPAPLPNVRFYFALEQP
jgi:alpha-tubulin suppressor-like RCC1 family protein